MSRVAGLLAITILAVAALAQTKPDFSGTWKLDRLRSRLDAIKAPKHLILKIEHRDPEIVITRIKDDTTTAFDLSMDGTPHEVAGDQSTKAIAEWGPSGDHLVWEIDQDTPEGPVTIRRRARLGTNGQYLTTILTIKDKTGEKTAYEFFERE